MMLADKITENYMTKIHGIGFCRLARIRKPGTPALQVISPKHREIQLAERVRIR